ncbi:DUF4271 domain-containing protein [Mucilaginibacter limnophilus]|uniref:DUF4271 domain-containing protein n=1 Tax=Mucilaginibacter limnophilus TaxID=1932778 RepID=A0A437MVE3_9SPHI|nr:DUF4271 domain-containing protein [Mucilaginibacter limnophilus]RVU01576.1 DUF4271 domain-containing protein [Mucilaginibacter limnophilus]
MARLFLITFLLAVISVNCFAQTDSSYTPVADTIVYRRPVSVLDSVARAAAAEQKRVSDSLAMVFIKAPDPGRPNQFVQEIMDKYFYKGYGFLDISSKAQKNLGIGIERKTRHGWIIGAVILILLYASFLRVALTKDVDKVFQSVFSRQVSSQIDEENSLLSTWGFLGLLLLFGLTFGVFLFQLAAYYQVYYPVSGFNLLGMLVLAVISLLALKLLLLKFIGFVFEISDVTNRYIAILCLTYFALTFVALPVAACLTLINAQLTPLILLIALVLAGVILVWLYLRNSIIIISNFRFSKFYLIIYLCALEICPILILVKALKI